MDGNGRAQLPGVSTGAEPPAAIADGRYEVERFLGKGARKRVFLARDTRLDRRVAIALVDLAGLDEMGLTRARREAEAMARLSESQHIVTVFDTGEEDGNLYLVTEYMSRGELSAFRDEAEGGRLPINEVLRIGIEVARGLEHAHSQGVVHRDLKPQNIWLGPDGSAKLGDFGLAVAADRSRLTVEGSMIGTVSYMPPEQALGTPAEARSDIYSLGAVLYELLCGAPPFSGDDATAIISQHVSSPPIAPSWHRADVPKPLDRLILRMLAKSPDERPESATEVREALEVITAASRGPSDSELEDVDALERLAETALVGREQEVKDLRAAVDSAASGHGRIVLIAGEQGIGKTRLAGEAATYSSLRGGRALWGRCTDDSGAPPYWPWVQIIRSYVSNRDEESLSSELGAGASDIAQIVSEIRERLPDLDEPGAMEPEQARFRLFDSITTFLLNISNKQPLTLVIDDLHTADRPSLLLLEFIAKSVPAARLLIVGTYRHDELDQDHPLTHLVATLGRQRGHQRFRLAGLSEEDVVAMLENASGQRPQAPAELAMVRAIHRNSEGNPYFIEEIMRHLVESGRIYRNEEGVWISDVKRVEDLGIPEGIRDAVGQRMAKLSDGCTELLKVGSVIGREFRPDVLTKVAESDPDTVEAALKEADGANVVHLADDGARYMFVHATVRDALRSELSTEQRLELHRRTGEVLEDLYEDRIESHLAELAHHFVEAAPGGDAGKAADYAWWAGEQAVAQHAYEDAVGHFEAALELLSEVDDEPARGCELQLALGDARWRLGDTTAAKETFLSAANLARKLLLADAFARAALGYGGGIGGFGIADRADETLLELLRAALKTLPEQDSVIRVRVLARLSVELYLTDAVEERNRLSRQAVEIAERIGDPRIHLLALYSRQWAIMGPDDLEHQLTAADEILRLARAVDDREMRFRGHHFKLNALLQLGDIAAVDREVKACGRLAQELRQPYYSWQAAVFRAMRSLLEGRFAEGEKLAQEAFQLGQQGHGEMASVVFGAHAYVFFWGQGRLGELVAGGETFADQYPDSAWPAALAVLYSEAGEDAKSRGVVNSFARQGFETLRRDANWMTAMSGLSMGAAGTDEAEAAEQLYDLLLPYADRCVVILTGAAGLGSTRFLLGMLARAMSRWDDAVEHLDLALSRNERAGVHFIAPWIRFELARALLGRGTDADRERALVEIDKGIEVGRRLEMRAQVERLMSLRLEALGAGPIGIETSIEIVAKSVEVGRPDLRGATAPDGTVTIMFSDIEDSTVLTERLGDQRWIEVLHRHNEIVRASVSRYGGFEVKSQGDGFMLAFASATNALRCAVAIQQELAAERESNPDSPLRVRIGMHTGEVLREESDFFGKNVILAARIAGKATGNEILVSSLLREIVASGGEFRFGDEREIELKGLTGTHRVFDLPWLEGGDLAGVPAAGGTQAQASSQPG
jgi:serine/threonine protein kinase/class 3 adenylate cyclase